MSLDKVTTAYEMFKNCPNLDFDLNNKNLSNLNNAAYMFYNTGITSIDNLTLDFTGASYGSATYMFGYCSKLTACTNLTITGSRNNDLTYMFGVCPNLTDISGLNLIGRLNCRGFVNSTGLTDLNLELLNLNELSDCSYFASPNLVNLTNLKINGYGDPILNNCPNLTTITNLELLSTYTNSAYQQIIPLANTLTSLTTLTNFTCNSTKKIRLDVTSALTTIGTITIPNCETFSINSATNLTSLTSVVGDNLVDLSYFAYYSKLANFPTMNTSNVQTFDLGFKGTKVTVYNDDYNLSNIRTMSMLFQDCSELTSVTITNTFNYTGSINTERIFDNCPNLTHVTVTDASKWYDGGYVDGHFGANSAITDLVFNNYNYSIIIPPLITDVAKLEALVNSAGFTPYASSNKIKMGATRKASISTTVINNAIAKGWVVE